MEEEAERLRKAVGSGDSAFVRARQVIAEVGGHAARSLLACHGLRELVCCVAWPWVQIEESDQQAAKALSQKAVLVHMCQRYKAEIEELNQQVDASQRQKLKLQDDIKAQAATLRQLRKDIKVPTHPPTGLPPSSVQSRGRPDNGWALPVTACRWRRSCSRR